MAKIKAHTGFREYTSQASCFWLDRDFDVKFKQGSTVDYTKLAAAQRAIGNFVNIVTGKQIPVVFQSSNSYTDGTKVTIGTKLDGTNFDPAVGLALHEGSHIAYTDFGLFKTPGGNYASRLANSVFGEIVAKSGIDVGEFICNESESKLRLIKDLLNWIEDRRIDYKVYTTAPGYRMYYESMYDKYFNNKIIDVALKNKAKVKENWDCYMFHIINFTNKNRQLDQLVKLREIWNLINLGNIQRLESTKDALVLSCEIFKIIEAAIVVEDPTESTENKPTDSGDSDDTTSNGSGSGNTEDEESDDEDGEGQYEEDSNQSESEEDEDAEDATDPLTDKEKEQLEKAIEAQKEFLDGEQKKSGKLTKNQDVLVNAMRESGTETRDVSTSIDGKSDNVSTIVIKKMTPALMLALPGLFESGTTELINGKTTLGSYASKRVVQNDEAVLRGLLLGKQLGSKLQLRNSDRTLKSTRLQAGKIDRRLVAQLGFDNANVFHRIVTDRFKNYFIHISIDVSGSMSGDKLNQAIMSAVAIAQAASMTTGIRVQISIRGTNHIGGKLERCVTIYAYDSAHDKISKIRNQFKYIGTFGCTPEGIAFKSILKDLKADARGDELIFINYSDGSPTSVPGVNKFQYNGVELTKRVVNDMRDLGMNIISYFIYDYIYSVDRDNFKIMYGVDAKFIKPDSMSEISKTINAKFLEMTK